MSKSRWLRIGAVVVGGLALAAIVAWALLPEPVEVEFAPVVRAPMQVSIDDSGEMRAQERFTVTAPVAGRLLRIELRDGDRVESGQVLARIAPAPLGARERSEAQARVAAAAALQREADEHARRAAESGALASRERERAERLSKEGFVSPAALDRARSAEQGAASESEAGAARARAAAAELRAARAALLAQAAVRGDASALVPVASPAPGRVLRVVDPSERVVAAGSPLMTVGDLSRLEAVIELLSSEAVRVAPGMPVLLEGWGGAVPLRARVRRVEPFAFTKVSALGVEEKRTRVIADLVDPQGPLGDGYRIEARIVVWSADDVLTVPASAVFRCADAWCAFAVDGRRARRRAVEVGQRNASQVQVLGGLSEGQRVVRHPGNDLEDGAMVRETPARH